MAKDMPKTNVMRLLKQGGVGFEAHSYVSTGAVGGADVADVLGQDPARVFKTLVTVGASGEHYVFLIPVRCSLDLKKAAKAVGEKSIAMIKEKELLPLTGYVHGGCSPIGMKKQFQTTLDITAEGFDRIIFSAGKIGYQVELSPADLKRILDFTFADLTVSGV